MQGKHLLWGQLKNGTKIHIMQAVKGERLQQFLEGRLPYKGKRLSSLEMTKGNKGEKAVPTATAAEECPVLFLSSF